jgi:uncharacterized protein (DUF433 family)
VKIQYVEYTAKYSQYIDSSGKLFSFSDSRMGENQQTIYIDFSDKYVILYVRICADEPFSMIDRTYLLLQQIDGQKNLMEVSLMFDRITFDPKIMGGRACIRGMRIPVSVIVNQIAHGASFQEILEGYPDLEQGDIQQALEYAAWLTQEEVHPLQVQT